ncbi:hypothetical protein HYV88_01250 [Candidatus Woesearchaeota archaeon]|nr:hypothetical protein [Candidatus Woesearchaeota archaeon]
MKNNYFTLVVVLLVLGIITFSSYGNIFLGNAVNRGYKGLYFLDEYGRLYVSGSAAFLGDLRFTEKVARDIELTKYGYLILDKYGNLFAFGDARVLGEVKTNDAVDLELKDTGYYVLDRSGKVFAFGDAKKYGEGKNNDYVDMELSSNGYYLLRKNGKVETFGDASFYGDLEDKDVVNLGLTDKGYLILEKNGKINAFGDAKDLGYDDKLADAKDIEVVKKNKGYYILDGHGIAYSYLAFAGFPGPEYSEEDKYIDMEILES